jgi:signal peptidase I
MSELFDLISIVPVFIAIITMSNAFLFSPATVDGASMEPSFYDLEDVIFEHVNLKPDFLDIVIFKVDDGSYWIKRVIGLPGDNVLIDHNEIFVNGTKIDQSFIEDENGSILSYTYCNNAHELVCEFNVPEHYYFVLGDNREHSTDSRSDLLGFVSEDQIYGRVIFKYNNVIRNFLK